MSKITIIPPGEQLPQTTHSTSLAPYGSGGAVSSTLARWQIGREERVYKALTARTQAVTMFYDAQTSTMEAYIRRERSAARCSEVHELIAFERDYRRAERAEELCELRHRHEISATRREAERYQVETMRVQAQQALDAQQRYGNAPHELAYKKQQVEMLDLDVAAAERQHVLDEYYSDDDDDGYDDSGDTDHVLDALYNARAVLLSHGHDTSSVDASIEAHKRNRGS